MTGRMFNTVLPTDWNCASIGVKMLTCHYSHYMLLAVGIETYLQVSRSLCSYNLWLELKVGS